MLHCCCTFVNGFSSVLLPIWLLLFQLSSNRVKSHIDTTKIISHFGCTKIFSPTLCNFVCGFLFVIMCDLCLWLCVWICLCDWQAHDTSSSVFLFLPILCRCWTYPIIWPLTFPIIWPLTFLIICHISSFKVRKKKVWIHFTISVKGVQF